MGRPLRYGEKNIVLPAYQKLPEFNARCEPKAKYVQNFNLIADPSIHLQWSFGGAEPISGLLWSYL